ncbi:AAA family ATPase [Thalassobacillus hwangdonensis]|uniref:AAA family ATPase n=1 Tax=Thalassobacillus hwangdonensis TaxID=546108 RepID=A0ABW3L1R9_9BACI
MPNKKIHIVGSVASGKTTLAKQLSIKLGIPYYELDNVVWERLPDGERRRTDEERDAHLKSILENDAWIIEGVHHEWVADSLEQAEQIIYLDTPMYKRRIRIVTRFIKQKLKLEKANYTPTFEIFRKMFKWNRHFETVGKPAVLEKLAPYEKKTHIVRKSNMKVINRRDA